MWPLPLAIAIFMAPESPWWLVRRGRVEDAKKSLLRLTSLDREADFDADETVAMIAHTTALEEQMSEGASYLDCFKGVDCELFLIVTSLDANMSQCVGPKSSAWSGRFRILVAILSSAIPPM
jgi:MFS transporter, SP family, general alpha glucoside:H+ symporter